MSEYIIECEYDFDNGWIPGEHREEIVRCCDCRYYREEWNRKLMRDTVYCEWLDGVHVVPNGFCAWGERRGDA